MTDYHALPAPPRRCWIGHSLRYAGLNALRAHRVAPAFLAPPRALHLYGTRYGACRALRTARGCTLAVGTADVMPPPAACLCIWHARTYSASHDAIALCVHRSFDMQYADYLAAFCLCRGGWPFTIRLRVTLPRHHAPAYTYPRAHLPPPVTGGRLVPQPSAHPPTRRLTVRSLSRGSWMVIYVPLQRARALRIAAGRRTRNAQRATRAALLWTQRLTTVPHCRRDAAWTVDGTLPLRYGQPGPFGSNTVTNFHQLLRMPLTP